MRVRFPVRVAAAGVGCALGICCGWGQAQGSKLPVTAPTTPTASIAAAAAVPTAATQGARSSEVARKPRVTWAQGELTISAENASLNQILVEISRQTGMKVTGGVTEERVYGEYGPGAPGPVLASLLLGTGSNMLLKENAANGPVELELTPRLGGVTPPGPSSYVSGREAEDDLPPQRIVPRSRPQTTLEGQPGQAASGVQGPGQLAPAQAVGSQPSSAGAAAGAPVLTDQQSPNGVKTPQQIYDQLMKLQQQKAAAQAAQQHPAASTPQ